MFGIGSKVVQRPDLNRMLKYMNNGVAIGVTATAKEGQKAVQTGVETKWRNRSSWFKQQSPIGIRVTIARGDQFNPTATVHTAAYFGPLQEKGGIKLPFSSTHLAIPAKGGPLANIRRRIPDELKPRALIASGKAFIETTEKGTQLLVVHGLRNTGKYRGNVLMYILVEKARIKPAHFFEEPIRQVCRRNLAGNISRGVGKSLGRLASRS